MELLNLTELTIRLRGEESKRNFVKRLTKAPGFPEPTVVMGRSQKLWFWPNVAEWLKNSKIDLTRADEYEREKSFIDKYLKPTGGQHEN